MTSEHNEPALPPPNGESLHSSAMQVSEIRYKRLFDAARDGILILDANTSEIIDSNPSMTKLLGYSREELYGKDLADIGVFKDKDAAREAMALLHRDSFIRYDNLPLQTKSCESRHVEFVSNVYSENGMNVIQCHIRDNTERRRMTHEAEEAERLADLFQVKAREQERDYVLSAARCTLYYADVTQSDHPTQLHWDSHFIDVAAAQAFLPLNLLPGEHYILARRRCRHPEDRDLCDALGARMIRAGKSYTQEFRSFCADDSVRWTREDVHVETITPDHFWRVVCVCTDITQMKEQQRALETTNMRLQRAMSETHHRVKNNLQIITALVDMQVMEGTETVPMSVLTRLNTQVKAFATLHELLTDEARHNMEARSLDALQMLGKLLSLLRATAGTTNIAFKGDHARLSVRQTASLCLIANEVITNAIKYGRDNVNITFNVAGPDAELVVEDNGPGFPEGFTPDTMSNNGLEMAYHLARADLSGSLDFETREESGGRVTLKIPQFARALLDESKSGFGAF